MHGCLRRHTIGRVTIGTGLSSTAAEVRSVAGRWALPSVFLGSLLLQLAWIVATPPFRASDEFDHAYRAAAVSRGEWSPVSPALHGRGELVTVPESLVRAAHRQCAALGYTGPDNCRPARRVDSDSVLVASAASRYNPAFYWMIGSVARPFDGANAVLAMRAAAALLCTVLLTLTVWSIRSWSRTWWAGAGLLVAITPVVVYSSAVAAPNGAEMMAALALWASMMGAPQAVDRTTARRLIWVAAGSSVVVANVRYLGPGFVVIIVACALLAQPRASLHDIWIRARGHVIAGSLVSALGLFIGLAWTFYAGTARVQSSANVHVTPMELLTTLSEQIPAWSLQTIAAFPYRNQPAPAVVYAVWLVLYLAFIIAAFVRSPRTARRLQVVVIGGVLLMPVLLAILTVSGRGIIWQGRYGLPLAFGTCLLAGLALDRRPPPGRLWRPAAIVGSWTMMAAHVVSVTNVLLAERASGISSGDQGWHQPGVLVVVGLSACGFFLLARGALTPPNNRHSVEVRR